MLFPNFKQTKKSILTVGSMSGLAMLLAGCNPTSIHNHSPKPTPTPTPSHQAVNYRAPPILYDHQSIPYVQGQGNATQILQFYNKGQNILLSQYDEARSASGDNFIAHARDLYTYDIANKKLTQLKTQSGQALLSCFTRVSGAVMSEDGKHLYFVPPNTQVSALYPSDASATIAEYDMATKKITPLLTNQSQFGDQYYTNPAGTSTPIESIWNNMINANSASRGLDNHAAVAFALSPDQQTLYFVAWADKGMYDDAKGDGVGIYALDLSQASHPIDLVGFSSIKIKNTTGDGWSGVWLTLSSDGRYLAVQSDSAVYGQTHPGDYNGFLVFPTSIRTMNLSNPSYLFQGNNPSGVYYRFLGFDPKDSSKFFVNVGQGDSWSIEQGSVGSTILNSLVNTQLRVPITSAQWNGQVALLSDPQGSPASFQIFDFNDKQAINIPAFPQILADIIHGASRTMNYQLIDGRTVVFADPYWSQNSNIYIYQYPLKKAKKS